MMAPVKAGRTYTMVKRAEAQQATAERILAEARSAFLDESYEQVTLASIAAAAGVSHQTVLNHFESKAGLLRAVVGQLTEEIDRHRQRAVPADPRSAIAVLLDDYERTGDANVRHELLAESFAEFAEIIGGARAYHRAWLERQFAPWLAVSPRERTRRLALLAVATDVKTWKLLRRQLGLGRRTTGELMVRLVEAVLGAEPDGGSA